MVDGDIRVPCPQRIAEFRIDRRPRESAGQPGFVADSLASEQHSRHAVRRVGFGAAADHVLARRPAIADRQQ